MPARCGSKAPRASSSRPCRRDLAFEREDSKLIVKRPTDRGEHRALHGLTRSLVNNMVEGVTKGFEKRLEIQGVGYRAQLKGRTLELALGFSHPARMEAPEGIDFEVPVPTQIVVQRDRQAGGRRGRGAHPQAAPARALQGQGRALRRRVRRPQGRQARMTTAVLEKRAPARQAPAPHPLEGDRHGRAPAAVRVPLEPRRRSLSSWTTQRGHTIASVRWFEPDIAALKSMERAKRAGELLAQRAKEAGIEACVFDRGGYKYHGQVKALAEGAREGGLTV